MFPVTHRCSSRVACRPSLACAHVFCPLFCRSPKIRDKSRSIKLGYFVCKFCLPVLTLLLNLHPYFKHEFDLHNYSYAAKRMRCKMPSVSCCFWCHISESDSPPVVFTRKKGARRHDGKGKNERGRRRLSPFRLPITRHAR